MISIVYTSMSAMAGRIKCKWQMVQVCLVRILVIPLYPVHLSLYEIFFIYHMFINISFPFIVFSLTMMFLWNFTVSFSLLRTRPRRKSFFTVEVMVDSTPSCLVTCHPSPTAKRLTASRPPRLSGTSVLVIPGIILFKTLLRIMI